RSGLGIFRENVEVAIPIEDAGVGQLELAIALAPPSVLPHQLVVGELSLGVLIEGLQIGMGGGRIEVEVGFLDILAVVALGAGEAEEPFLQNRIPAVPQ